MTTYQDEHNIPSDSTSPQLNSTSNPRHSPRPVPRSFEDFLAEVQRIATAVGTDAFGDVDGGGLMVDSELWEEVFGEEGTSKGASPDFIKNLKHVTEEDLVGSSAGEDQSCPICLQPYHSILTEQEYAINTDHYVGDVDEMGLRELPCGSGGSSDSAAINISSSAIPSGSRSADSEPKVEEDSVPMPDGGEVKVGGKTRMGHVVCGKCVGKWLKLNNTCPLCRAILDTSIAPPNSADPLTATGPNYTDQMLELFRQLFGHGYGRVGEEGAGRPARGGTRGREAGEAWGGAAGNAGGMFSISPGREGELARRMDREEFSGMYS